MYNNYIKLIFDPTVTRLAGYDFGRDTYMEQVEGRVNFANTVTIEFPDTIIKIASSFVQGFFKEIIQNTGLDAVSDKVKIISGSAALTESIFKNLT